MYLAEGEEYNEEEANKMTWKATYDVATDTMVSGTWVAHGQVVGTFEMQRSNSTPAPVGVQP